jgi:hypothetical protein
MNSTYTVKVGDSLSSIARDVLGDMGLWTYLASINKIASPFIIRPGDQLIVDLPEVTPEKKKNNTLLYVLLAAAAAGTYLYYNKKKKKK